MYINYYRSGPYNIGPEIFMSNGPMRWAHCVLFIALPEGMTMDDVWSKDLLKHYPKR